MKPFILWDFDGTLYRGNRPFTIYSSMILDLMGMEDSGEVREIERRLTDYDHFYGNDGYEIVARMFPSAPPSVMQAAYEGMREVLLQHPEYVEVPVEIRRILERGMGKCTMILASNSPEPYVTPFLEELNLDVYFDNIISRAQKPQGVKKIIGELPESADLISIGDHYVNDIIPAAELGKDTAFISRYQGDRKIATFTGNEIEDISPEINGWIEKKSQ
ncbi:MAG: HAD family hydrolase [Candidatus Thermoplasmatota archaeon]|jgi:FMN phosphatase YigB (HAD superfamily)|nr:HAD family hydrolase [Candidatus Thermoplasmatota archaeon]MCL5791175.1 HAD family hydrolase [Candidatus Thermoplasmatota archaeon]